MLLQRQQNRLIAPLDINQDQNQKLSLRKKICSYPKVLSFLVALIGFCISLGFVMGYTTVEQEGKNLI